MLNSSSTEHRGLMGILFTRKAFGDTIFYSFHWEDVYRDSSAGSLLHSSLPNDSRDTHMLIFVQAVQGWTLTLQGSPVITWKKFDISLF